MNINIWFGKKIKKLRKAKGLSQEKLALLAEIDRTYMPSIEKGESNISIAIMEKLIKALDEEIETFFKGYKIK